MLLGARTAMWAKTGGDAPAYWGLCFTAEQANSTVAMAAVNSAPSVSLLYSTDGTNWDDFIVGTTTVTLANVGDKVYVKAGEGGNTKFAYSDNEYNKFVLGGRIAASGNVMSLLDGGDEAVELDAPYTFVGMFRECTALTSAPELPATTLANNCYSSMFNGCTSLATAPSLPATILATYCYNGMFRGCTSLATAPSLPATTLASNCYNGMFRGCTSLATAPSLPVTTLATYCYNNMFRDCTSLTAAPSLPATALVGSCYRQMFQGCTHITEIEVAFSAWSSSSGTKDWMVNAGSAVSTTKTFRCPTALGTDATITRGNSNCPEGWTVVNTDA